MIAWFRPYSYGVPFCITIGFQKRAVDFKHKVVGILRLALRLRGRCCSTGVDETSSIVVNI